MTPFIREVSKMADASDGVVTRRQLVDADLDLNDVQAALDRDLLAPVFPGVYAVCRQALTQPALLRAATSYLAPSMVIGRCAAEHRDLLKRRQGVVSVVTSRRRHKGALRTLLPMLHSGQPGLVTYRPVRSVEAVCEGGVPLASMTRMLIDIAAAERTWMLERVWKEADYRGLLDLEDVDRELRTTRRQGSPEVRALLARHPGRPADESRRPTPTEVDFLQMIIDAGLPVPQVNVVLWLAGGVRYVADFFWAFLGLVAELDDPSHDRPLAKQSDTLRDADFADADLDVIRFDTRVVAIDPPASMRRLGAVIDLHRRRLGLD